MVPFNTNEPMLRFTVSPRRLISTATSLGKPLMVMLRTLDRAAVWAGSMSKVTIFASGYAAGMLRIASAPGMVRSPGAASIGSAEAPPS